MPLSICGSQAWKNSVDRTPGCWDRDGLRWEQGWDFQDLIPGLAVFLEEHGAVQTELVIHSFWEDLSAWQSCTIPSHLKCRALSPSRVTNNKNTAALENLFSATHRSKPFTSHYLHLVTAHVHDMPNRWRLAVPNTRHDRKSPLPLHTFQFSLHHITA